MTTRFYYAVRYRLDHADRWLLWYSGSVTGGDDADGVVVDQTGRMPVFAAQQDLLAYAQAAGLSPVETEGSGFHNLDIVVRWLRRKRPAQLDCTAFLEAWNLFADISASVGGSFASDKDRTRKIADKLFWGCNLPAVTPVGHYFTPAWRNKESKLIRQVLRDGLSLFRSRALPIKPRVA